jgi:hypothetical protein
MTAQHGILKPNPILFDLEKRKKKPVLAHELGAGKLMSHPLDPVRKNLLKPDMSGIET